MACLKLKNWTEAEEDATRALRHDPSYQKAYFRRAQARDQLGKLDGAEMDYKEQLLPYSLQMLNFKRFLNFSFIFETLFPGSFKTWAKQQGGKETTGSTQWKVA